MPTVLGVSCSLRNARFGVGSARLVDEIARIKDEDDLIRYLSEQTKLRVEDFVEAGRRDKRPFDEIYANLRRLKGDRGLSNSEAALVAGLWGAAQTGARIMHCGLSTYFPITGEQHHLDQLREIVLKADAILISGPVYFGDRGSLAQEFIEFVRDDPTLAEHIKGRVYGGLSVGAKRNGGQETTLIYQLVDMTNMSMLAVGNDSETTSQYGGTSVAGDVGTLADDIYGIRTSLGTGRRVANMAIMLEAGAARPLRDNARISVWLLQDSPDHHGFKLMERFKSEVTASADGVDIEIRDFTAETIYRCIACDLCPTELGAPEDYRCIISAEGDLFRRCHAELIDTDAVLLAAYSPIARADINSVYQRFIERTRYMRRDNYVIGDRLTAPFVISELNSNQNLHIRMLTSFLRHHTVLHHPVIGMESGGQVLNWDSVIEQGLSFVNTAKQLTAGRLASSKEDAGGLFYNPVGYFVSAEKSRVDKKTGKLREAQDTRRERHEKVKSERIS